MLWWESCNGVTVVSKIKILISRRYKRRNCCGDKDGWEEVGGGGDR